jgi:putative endonuclease
MPSPARPRRSSPPAPGTGPRGRAATGRRGEDVAAAHLRRLGFAILDRNVHGRGGEIDLIACDGRVLAFVEVKTTLSARGSRLAAPLERLGVRQRARLRRVALAWLLRRSAPRPRAPDLRFDAIGVVLDAEGRLLALEHVEAAW